MADHELPWFKFFPRDWLSEEATSLMSLREKGAFIDLLARSWADRGIPDDREKVARLLRISEEELADIWPTLREQFVSDGNGRLLHPELAIQREEILERKRTFQEAGRRGAMKRWGAEGDHESDSPPNGEANGDPSSPPNGEASGEADGDPMAYTDTEGAEAEGEGRGGISGGRGSVSPEGAKSTRAEDPVEETEIDGDPAESDLPPIPF